jgi:hypothetical protein
VVQGHTWSGYICENRQWLSRSSKYRKWVKKRKATCATPIASPLTERTKPRSSDRHQHSRRDRHHRRDRDRRRERRSRHRDTLSTSTVAEMHHLRSRSPIVPTAYPYPYPYSYTAYPSFPSPAPVEPSYSNSTPCGPRSHRAPTFPHGYVPYQPPPPVPPMYVIHSSPAQTQASGSGDTSHGQIPSQGQMLSPVYIKCSSSRALSMRKGRDRTPRFLLQNQLHNKIPDG